MTRFKQSSNGGGGGSGEGPGVLRPMLDLPFAGPCNQSNFNPNLSNLLTEDQIQWLVNFLNSPAAAQTMWTERRYTGVDPGRLEQAGFLLPDGTLQWAQIDSQGPCNVTFNAAPGSFPAGTILSIGTLSVRVKTCRIAVERRTLNQDGAALTARNEDW